MSTERLEEIRYWHSQNVNSDYADYGVMTYETRMVDSLLRYIDEIRGGKSV